MHFTTFNNKNILVTGHTGFKGSWLCLWLEQLGARLTGIALDPPYADGVFERSGLDKRMADHRVDIRDAAAVRAIFEQSRPEIVFHLAAQPLVLESYRDPAGTFATNVQGTVHVLEAIRHTPSVRAAVVVTTDKCYENQEWVHGYRETDPMGGHDPYSASKGAAELVVSSYRRSFFAPEGRVALASARAGNVIGGGDWSANRITPDIVRAFERGEVLDIRNPSAVRPWQHVLEPLGGYLLLAQKLLETPAAYAEAWNFGPLPHSVHPVRRVADAMFGALHGSAHPMSRPAWRDASDPRQPHEANLLMLDVSKAIHRLGWRPVLDFDETIRFTAEWYARYRQTDVHQLCLQQIQQYRELWKSKNEH